MRILWCLVALVLISAPTYAHTHLLLYSGSTSPLTSFQALEESSYLDDYWKPAENLGLAAEFSIGRAVVLGPSVEWSSFPFAGYHAFIQPPEYRLKESSGDRSNIYRLFVDAKLMPRSEQRFHAYLLTGFGYVVEQIGRIRVVWSDMNGPDFTHEIQYSGKSYWAHSAGLGLRYFPFRPLGLDASAKYYSNYDDRFQGTLTLGLVYNIG